MLKGMLLAAGRGTRLGALTDTLPKPLLPVGNHPVLAQGLSRMRHLGIHEVCINISYRGFQIMDMFGDGSAYDLQIRWAYETEPAGTAGGMKALEAFLKDDLVIVIAGDAMLDIDLQGLLDAHRAAGAFASLGTLKVEDPSEYGVVVTDADGRILSFQEKPAPGTEISRMANTGIYVFEPGIFSLIPGGEFVDFARMVFPHILERGLPFYAFPVTGYWTDIGNPRDYWQANMDYLDGRVCVDLGGAILGTNRIAETAQVAGAHLTHCVVGAGAVIPPTCALTSCVVWPETRVPDACTLDRAVLTPHGLYRVEGKHLRPWTPDVQELGVRG